MILFEIYGLSRLCRTSLLGSLGLAGAVSNVGDALATVGDLRTQSVRARRLVALAEIESADLVVSVLAEGIGHVDELVVLVDPAVGLAHAAGHVVHAVGGGQGQLAVVEEVAALAGIDELVGHVDAAAGVGVLLGALAEAKVVPGIVGDVVGAAGLVDLEEVEASVAVGDLDADVVAVNAHGPVGNTVGVDEAAQHADGGRVLLVGSDACASALTSAAGDRNGRDGGSRGSQDSSDGGEHFEVGKQVNCFVEEGVCVLEVVVEPSVVVVYKSRKEWRQELRYEGMNRSQRGFGEMTVCLVVEIDEEKLSP